MKFDALILDFDGVLIESEFASNRQIAEFLTGAGFPTSVEESMREFMGLSQGDFLRAIERWVGGPLPDGFLEARRAEDRRVLGQGLPAVAGAVAFAKALPSHLPRAIASSSSRDWIRTHLDHLDLRDLFEPHIYSGKEDVARGKPAPDLYLHAADALGVPIERTLIVEDSPVGAQGAVASGAHVVGLVAGSHCLDGHADRLRGHGVHSIASDFGEIDRLFAL